jgi:hypothetical protein
VRKCKEEKQNGEGISLISKLRGLLEMNAAFVWRVMVRVSNMVPQYRAYITQHNAYQS